MKPTKEELWSEMEQLIDGCSIQPDGQSFDALGKFRKTISPNDEFREFVFQRVMESWDYKTVRHPDMRYDELFFLLGCERAFCKKRFLNLDELAVWIAEQWNDLLQHRLSIRESSFKNKGRYIYAVEFRKSISFTLVVCLSAIASECALKQLEAMRDMCLETDNADIEETIAKVKLKIERRNSSP